MKQAGRHLLRIVQGNPGTNDHIRVAELCLKRDTLVEVERIARFHQEFSVDIDDAVEMIRQLMDGKTYPLSSAQAQEIDAESLEASIQD
ncbi:hypothetical protein [Rhodoferax ferrireducens]|uniref:hypothetical protein n=1 Tax=Rhodoferax ferrireducens TaxID=192843 RepID=UPI0005A16EEC|nr:hypothetical protein [Rhodoferax ferrireducens]